MSFTHAHSARPYRAKDTTTQPRACLLPRIRQEDHTVAAFRVSIACQSISASVDADVVVPHDEEADVDGHARCFVGRGRWIHEPRVEARCSHVLLGKELVGGRVSAVIGGEEKKLVWVHRGIVQPPVPARRLCRIEQAIISAHAAILDDFEREYVLAAQRRMVQNRKMRRLAAIKLAPAEHSAPLPSGMCGIACEQVGML